MTKYIFIFTASFFASTIGFIQYFHINDHKSFTELNLLNYVHADYPRDYANERGGDGGNSLGGDSGTGGSSNGGGGADPAP